MKKIYLALSLILAAQGAFAEDAGISSYGALNNRTGCFSDGCYKDGYYINDMEKIRVTVDHSYKAARAGLAWAGDQAQALFIKGASSVGSAAVDAKQALGEAADTSVDVLERLGKLAARIASYSADAVSEGAQATARSAIELKTRYVELQCEAYKEGKLGQDLGWQRVCK